MTRLALLAIGIAALVACRGDCSKCQVELDHLAENLAFQDCNPNFMDTAVSRVESGCADSHPDWELYISQMVDQCQANVHGASVQIGCDCSFDPGYDTSFPIEFLATNDPGSTSEIAITNPAGIETFTGPWAGEAYTGYGTNGNGFEAWTFTIRDAENEEIFSEDLEFEVPMRGRESWSPYIARAIRIETGPVNLSLENFEIE